MTWGWYRVLMLLSLVLSPASVAAEELCHLNPIGEANVATVLDGRTFTLDDGREVRLAGIELPASTKHTGLARAAKTQLAALTVGRKLSLKRVGSNQDRYGRLVVYAFMQNEDQSLNAKLLAMGLARTMPAAATEGCVQTLFASEAMARASGLGLWSDPAFLPLKADDAASVLAERGRFGLIEGKVLSVHEAGPAIYVNFGQHWSSGFSVVILKRNRRMFSAAGVEPKALDHHRIRVRGIIERRRGPIIEAEHPEQIEIIDERGMR
ncbi:MAG TPA: thermonuclease family protein [Pseudolabrys sp.]|nr:thermonuclease family protein [Pseudolabrys sp.]